MRLRYAFAAVAVTICVNLLIIADPMGAASKYGEEINAQK